MFPDTNSIEYKVKRPHLSSRLKRQSWNFYVSMLRYSFHKQFLNSSSFPPQAFYWFFSWLAAPSVIREILKIPATMDVPAAKPTWKSAMFLPISSIQLVTGVALPLVWIPYPYAVPVALVSNQNWEHAFRLFHGNGRHHKCHQVALTLNWNVYPICKCRRYSGFCIYFMGLQEKYEYKL